MGCSSSRPARGADVGAPPERRQSLRSRSLSRAASAMGTLGLCRGRHDVVHAYSMLPPSEETAKSANEAAEGRREVPMTEAQPAANRGLAAALGEASPAPESIMAQWRASPSGGWGETPPPPVVQLLPDFDPVIASRFQETMLGPSPSHPALLFPERENPPSHLAVLSPERGRPPPRETNEEASDDMGTPAARDIPEVTGFVRARVDEFHEKIEKKKRAPYAAAPDVADEAAPLLLPARTGKAVVVYFTSLRGVRRTFEDCRAVRSILRCYRVRVDERDVSMHAAFKEELRTLLGGGAAAAALPRAFVGGRRDLGGADDVRALHEAGELARALAGCELAAHGGGAAPCVACCEMRFLPCETCSGSCKVFAGDEGCRLAGMFLRCPDCNENGLVRCPVCCY